MPELVFQFSCFDELLTFKTDWYQSSFQCGLRRFQIIRLTFRPEIAPVLWNMRGVIVKFILSCKTQRFFSFPRLVVGNSCKKCLQSGSKNEINFLKISHNLFHHVSSVFMRVGDCGWGWLLYRCSKRMHDIAKFSCPKHSVSFRGIFINLPHDEGRDKILKIFAHFSLRKIYRFYAPFN